MNSVIGELNALMGEPLIVIFRTDACQEFLNNTVKELMISKKKHAYLNSWVRPKSKRKSRQIRGHHQSDKYLVLYACKPSVGVLVLGGKTGCSCVQDGVVNKRAPEDVPTFGHRVMVREPTHR